VPSPTTVEDSLVQFVPEHFECWCAAKGAGGVKPLPRQVLVAVGRERVYVFAGPLATTEPLATLHRPKVSVAHSGKRYRRNRFVLIERGGERRRSYAMTVSGWNGGKVRRLEHTVAVLRG
jgi:hypothetical protein